MEYSFDFVKARIYINSQKKSLAAIKKETGCDVILNGGLYNMTTFKPLCHLKADGKVYVTDEYGYWGYGWNNDDTKLQMVADYHNLDNYICCTALVKGKKPTTIFYDDGQGGIRGRTVIGTLTNGKTAIFCSKDKTADAMTPEALQWYCLQQGWMDAVMLDSGGSSQCITPEGQITSTRIVHNVLCFWLKKEDTKTQDVNETMGKRKLGTAGLELIKEFEGCRLTAYKPVATEKYWTIGWGHYGADVVKGMTITQARADALLLEDVADSVAVVNNPNYCPITASLNQNQFDALVSFCFNCGAGNLKTLCANRTAAQIAEKIPAYNKAGGNVLNGLVRRRAAEVKLFNTAVDVEDPTTVKEVQEWLNEAYGSRLVADGLYGAKTKKALVKALQLELGVDADGIYGAKTNEAVKTLKNGSSGILVKILQCFLICRNQTVTADGNFGNQTELAVKAVQRQFKIGNDGIAGKMTFKALCG